MQGNRSGWFKSSYSMQNGDCVEVRNQAVSGMDLRDSKVSNGPVLTFTASEWTMFIRGVRAGEFEVRG
ncbi:DUF397 domain-containing protein [Streptomyces milbemycinicus]|nr:MULTISPECIES: DUF397 domain-containing protein [Streptomyces]